MDTDDVDNDCVVPENHKIRKPDKQGTEDPGEKSREMCMT